MCAVQKSINISFDDIKYPDIGLKQNSNTILKNISGCFCSGELTGILGGSGAGKTTLLNILAGQTTTNISGTVSVNGRQTNPKEFKRISTYLMQDDLLQPLLTVKEAMMISASLKLDAKLTREDKERIAMEIIDSLSLTNCINTRTESLSGGQKRRFSMALELVSNPQVLFLDEPTSGLDNVAAKQNMEMLKSLALQGKTVICTIHQPSDLIFQMFDHVYFMDSGVCIYDDVVSNLVPFLSQAGHDCPKTYNPADYILEICQQDGRDTLTEIAKCSNRDTNGQKTITNDCEEVRREVSHPVGQLMQMVILMRRNFIQIGRSRSTIAINTLQHVLCGMIIGLAVYSKGNDARRAFDIFKLATMIQTYIYFGYGMVPILLFPQTAKIIRRELTNNWYSFNAYFIAELLTPIPMMFLLCNVFTGLYFNLSNPTPNLHRYILMSVIIMLTAMVSHLFGMCIAAVFNAKNGAIMGPVLGAPLVMLTFYGLGYGDSISSFMLWIRQISFLRYGVVGMNLAQYGWKTKLDCPDIFCPHASVQRYMKDMEMEGASYTIQIYGLVFFGLVYCAICYVLLSIKFLSGTIEKLKNFKIKYSKLL